MTCHKTQYSTKKIADDDIKRIITKNKLDIRLYSYLCTNCSSWHITKQKPFELNCTRLKEEYDALKLEVSELKKSIKLNLKRDEQIIALRKQIENYKKVIDRQKSNINTLINENLKLKNDF